MSFVATNAPTLLLTPHGHLLLAPDTEAPALAADLQQSLTDDVLRLAGETLEELQTRAAGMIKGPWPPLLGLMYANDTPLN